MPPDQLVARCQGVDALLFSLSEPMTKALVDRLPASVKVAATYSVGTDHIDVAAARRGGLKIGNAPHGVTIATAEIAMLLILGAARRAPEGERMVREDRWLGWRPTEMLGMRLDGKSLGIVGMGKIGRELAKRQQQGFGGVVTFKLHGGLTAAKAMLGATKVFGIADSLGGVESTISHSATMSHAGMPRSQREIAGITEEVIRLSVGIEDPDLLINELTAAVKLSRN